MSCDLEVTNENARCWEETSSYIDIDILFALSYYLACGESAVEVESLFIPPVDCRLQTALVHSATMAAFSH